MKSFAAQTLIALTVAAVQGCCSPSSSVGAARARSLTSPQLGAMYSQMERLKDQDIDWGERNPLPREFSEAGALYGDVGHLDRLVFGGCMDDKAALVFDGLRANGPRQVRLIPGENQRDEVLWRDPVPSGAPQ